MHQTLLYKLVRLGASSVNTQVEEDSNYVYKMPIPGGSFEAKMAICREVVGSSAKEAD